MTVNATALRTMKRPDPSGSFGVHLLAQSRCRRGRGGTRRGFQSASSIALYWTAHRSERESTGARSAPSRRPRRSRKSGSQAPRSGTLSPRPSPLRSSHPASDTYGKSRCDVAAVLGRRCSVGSPSAKVGYVRVEPIDPGFCELDECPGLAEPTAVVGVVARVRVLA